MSRAVLALILLIISIIGTSILFWTRAKPGRDNIRDYADVIYHLSVLVIIMAFFFGEMASREAVREKTLAARLAEHQSMLESIQHLFLQYDLGTLYNEMYSSAPPGAQVTAASVTPAQHDAIVHAAPMIFYRMDSAFWRTTSKNEWNDTFHRAWLRIWREWFKSPMLLQQWQFQKRFFTEAFQDFVDRYIIGGEEFNQQTQC